MVLRAPSGFERVDAGRATLIKGMLKLLTTVGDATVVASTSNVRCDDVEEDDGMKFFGVSVGITQPTNAKGFTIVELTLMPWPTLSEELELLGPGTVMASVVDPTAMVLTAALKYPSLMATVVLPDARPDAQYFAPTRFSRLIACKTVDCAT